MRCKIHPHWVKLWLSAHDTEEWATRPGKVWPCSTLSGRRVFAEFDSNGLVDLVIYGGQAADCDVNEFNALTSDALAACLPADHPCYFVAVGQFRK